MSGTSNGSIRLWFQTFFGRSAPPSTFLKFSKSTFFLTQNCLSRPPGAGGPMELVGTRSESAYNFLTKGLFLASSVPRMILKT